MTPPESRLFGHARRRTLPTRPPMPVWKWLLPTLAAAGLSGWLYTALNAPRDLPVQPAALTRSAAQDWESLRAFGPREPGGAGHARAVAWLASQLEALGYTVTRQSVPLTRVVDEGSALTVGGQRFPTRSLYGVAGGEFTGRLVRVPPDAGPEALEQLGLQGGVALTACSRAEGWNDLLDRLMRAGAQGAVLIDTCPDRPRRPVDAVQAPAVLVPASSGAALYALAGREAQLSARTFRQPVTGTNLIAHRVGATPEVLISAHHDTLAASPGAESNGSGMLAVLGAARRAVGTPLHDRAWFVLFDGGEQGLLGSHLMTREYVYPLRQTRAMLNLDGVGRADARLEAALDEALQQPPEENLEPVLTRVRPGLHVFTETHAPEQLKRRAPGGGLPLIGNSDHQPFKYQHVRTVLVRRGVNPLDGQPGDTRLDPAAVEDAAGFTWRAAQALLDAPWTPREPCSLNGRGC